MGQLLRFKNRGIQPKYLFIVEPTVKIDTMERYIVLLFVLVSVAHMAQVGGFKIDPRCDGKNPDDCCTGDNQCSEGGGDCDTDHHCQGRLICGDDNCDVGAGFDDDDCCTQPPNACNTTNNGGCSQICHNDVGLAVCSCRPGFIAVTGTNGALCDKMSPSPCLARNGGCGQICNDNEGNVMCSCNEGFGLQSDGKSCNALDIQFAGKVKYMNVDNGHCTSVTQDECSKIAATLDIPFHKISNNAYPSGCFQSKVSQKIYFNEERSSIVACSTAGVCLCKVGGANGLGGEEEL